VGASRAQNCASAANQNGNRTNCIARHLPARAPETILEHVITYRRPANPWSLGRMTVQTDVETAAQVQRLISLGYTVIDVLPPMGKG